MARIRSIKPEFWSDEKLAPADLLTRFVFLGIISMADDLGRLPDNVKQIDAFVFPETSDTSRESLARLSDMGRIRRGTTASGQRVIQIVNWEKHQKVDHPNVRAAFPELVVVPLVAEIREPVAKDSRESSDALATRSTIYDQDQRSGPTIKEASAAARASKVETFLTEARQTRFAEQFEGAIRSARDPETLVQELQALRSGLNSVGGVAVPLEVLGQAIADMRVNGDPLSARRLRVFCADLMKAPRPDASVPGESLAESIARGAEAAKSRTPMGGARATR